MKTAELIFAGRNHREGTSGIENPVVKLGLLLAPLLCMVYLQIGRKAGWPRLSLREVTIVAALLYIANILNFSDKERSKMIVRAVKTTLFVGGIFYVASNPKSDVAAVVGIFFKLYSTIPILGSISPESWLYCVFIFIAWTGVANLTTRDVLWIGRRILWDYAFTAYTIVVVTFAVIHSALPLRIGLSWRIAQDKALLLKNPYLRRRVGLGGRFLARMRIFAVTFIGSNTSISQAVELLCDQRGFFRFNRRDTIGGACSIEDICAIALCGLSVFIVVVLRI